MSTGVLTAGLSGAVTVVITWALLALAVLVLVLLGLIAAQRSLRRRRAERLRRRTEPLRPLLLELVAGEPDEQAEAGARLAAVSAPAWRSVEPAVVALLSKVRGESRTEVVGLLESRGVLDRAREDLRRRGAVRRARAAELLGAAGDTGSVPTLLELLTTDRAAEVRIVAARALGRVGAAEAARTLLHAVGEDHGPGAVPPQVVAHALLRIGPAAADDLAAALTDGSAPVRATALEILGRVGAVGSVAAVRRCLRDDDSPEVRARAATALGRLGMPSALEDLVAAAGGPLVPGDVRACAVTALGELGDARAVPALRVLLADADGHVAALVGPALVRLGEPARAVLHEVAGTDVRPDADAAPCATATSGALVVARAREALALAQLLEGVPAQRGPSTNPAVPSGGHAAGVGA